jgi:hypothetical protein
MFIINTTSLLGTTVVMIPSRTERWLTRKHFRRHEWGQPNLAGKFSRWGSLADVLADKFILNGLVAEATAAFWKNTLRNGLTIDYGELVGWARTDSLDKYDPRDIEEFRLGWEASGVRVRIGRGDLPAPQTNLITIAYEIRPKVNGIAIVIDAIYPGKDIGQLVGDVSRREKCVFFHWSHPGKL